jgi:hypothetical protein
MYGSVRGVYLLQHKKGSIEVEGISQVGGSSGSLVDI